jgi:NAD(P)-dependent dehydrogenase (short-subunit alcohol dehydrogenase family)/acyl dehydratase
VPSTFRLTHEHLHRFAEASGDRNPLHIDPDYARRTPFGRCISHGALVAIAALGAADAQALRGLRSLVIQFKQPVFPDEASAVSLVETSEEKTRIEVTGRGRLAAAISFTSDGAEVPVHAFSTHEQLPQRDSPRHYTFEELAKPDVSVREPYGCRLDVLTSLAAELGAGAVPDGVLIWLAGASYTIGMLLPGRDALFVGARIVGSPAVEPGTLTASIGAADDRTGLMSVEASLDQTDPGARMTLHAFLRPPIPAPDRSSIGHYLPPSKELSGQNVLIVGASRGLGAAVCGAFATQGAAVWAAFARSAEEAEGLRAEFGIEQVRPIQFDAEDAEESRRAFEKLRAEAGTLDGVVLCAAPPLYETAIHPAASEEMLRFLHASLAMSLVPLAEALQLLRAEGWLVIVSSSALDDPPDAWPHYVVAKAALEGLAAYCARRTEARVLVVRAPKMWTDSTNTPMGRIGAMATEQVAAAVARCVMSEERRNFYVITPDMIHASSAEAASQE